MQDFTVGHGKLHDKTVKARLKCTTTKYPSTYGYGVNGLGKTLSSANWDHFYLVIYILFSVFFFTLSPFSFRWFIFLDLTVSSFFQKNTTPLLFFIVVDIFFIVLRLCLLDVCVFSFDVICFLVLCVIYFNNVPEDLTNETAVEHFNCCFIYKKI